MHRKVGVSVFDLCAILPRPSYLVVSPSRLLHINIPRHYFTGRAGLFMKASLSDLDLYFIIRVFNDEFARRFF